jgi:hypothetical protein
MLESSQRRGVEEDVFNKKGIQLARSCAILPLA